MSLLENTHPLSPSLFIPDTFSEQPILSLPLPCTIILHWSFPFKALDSDVPLPAFFSSGRRPLPRSSVCCNSILGSFASSSLPRLYLSAEATKSQSPLSATRNQHRLSPNFFFSTRSLCALCAATPHRVPGVEGSKVGSECPARGADAARSSRWGGPDPAPIQP
jgi:hypothetical protein